MPKVNEVRIDGVNYNADHAKVIGKEVFINSKEMHHHHQHLSETDRKKAMSAIYDQLVAPMPPASAAAAVNN